MSEPIRYFELIPGRGAVHFECGKIHGTLSFTDCAARFRKAQASLADDEDCRDRYHSCRRCGIGAAHLAQAKANQTGAPAAVVRPIAPDIGAACCRCGNGAVRIMPTVGLCVSCGNRFAEYRRGRNAKGTACSRYVPPRLRRVGIVVDGAPAWRMLEGQNPTEPLARARRAALEMHGRQPGRAVWSTEAARFEYRDEAGRVLLELQVGDEIHYLAVDRLHPGEVPAPVLAPTFELPADVLATWLRVSGEVGELLDDWRAQPVLCGGCHHAPLQARRRAGRAGRAEVRCLGCGDVGMWGVPRQAMGVASRPAIVGGQMGGQEPPETPKPRNPGLCAV